MTDEPPTVDLRKMLTSLIGSIVYEFAASMTLPGGNVAETEAWLNHDVAEMCSKRAALFAAAATGQTAELEQSISATNHERLRIAVELIGRATEES